MENVSPARADVALNPSTRLALAGSAMVTCLALPRWAPPVIIGTVLIAALLARKLRGLAIVIAALTPLLISTVVINLLLPSGGSRLGGLRAGLLVLGLSLAPALLFLTTPMDEVVADLERRGLPAKAAHVVTAAVAAVPRARAMAIRVAEARRARGLDRRSSLSGRLRGLLELTGPVVYATLAEAEDRTLALEARGFGSVRHRTILDPHVDSRAQRVLRWVLVGLTVAAVIAGLVLR
ncbi:MAG: energy-coupling factor transporter transmembrane protein EcfT [Candidatus Dormibacteraeota bacterium]|nr:energy-coupling factor transporter transmembrane protein EcfT [Candidatus Dormibacteraeota bacterium]